MLKTKLIGQVSEFTGQVVCRILYVFLDEIAEDGRGGGSWTVKGLGSICVLPTELQFCLNDRF